MSHDLGQTVLFPGVLDKKVELTFDTEESTSDAGLLLLRAADRRLGLLSAMSASIEDNREGWRVQHDVEGLVAQRVYGLAAGYEDCNDVERLRHEPILTRLKRRDRSDGEGLASQPTLSRFENAVSSRDLVRMSHALMDTVIAGCRRDHGPKKTRRLVIDLDSTCDRAHGRQQLISFRTHYDTHCYVPLLAFLSFDEDAEQHLVSAVLRAGSAPDSEGVVALLSRLVPKLRKAFPGARLIVRADGGFCTPEILQWLEDQHLLYVMNLPKNKALEDDPVVFDLMDAVRWQTAKTGEVATAFGEIEYAANSWDEERRVIVKASVALCAGREPRDNPRFLVTNLRWTPANVHAFYAARGDPENRIKELKNDLSIDRTSCQRFFANQLRVLLTAAAYVLFQHLRRAAHGTDCESAQVGTLRLRLLKIGARVVESCRRLVIHGPSHFPWLSTFRIVARRLTAGLA